MIHVYRYRALPDDYQSVSFPGLTDDIKGRQITPLKELVDGIPIGANWRPLAVQVDLDEVPLPEGDFPSIVYQIPIFSQRAWDVLGRLIGDRVEALPITYPSGKPYYAINVLDVVDCLDLEHCETNKNPHDPHDCITAIFKYAFKEEAIWGKHIFKAPEMLGLATYVSAEFKRIVEENGLRGLNFRQIYPHPAKEDIVEERTPFTAEQGYADSPMGAEDWEELEKTRAEARANLGLDQYGPEPTDIVAALGRFIELWRTEQPLGHMFADGANPNDYALWAGIAWGDQLVRALGWEWVRVEPAGLIGVVSPDRAYAAYPQLLASRIVTFACFDNTLLRIFNLAKANQLPPSSPRAYRDITDGSIPA